MSDATRPRKESIYVHMARGSAWGVAMRWAVRGIGLVNTMILARILVPEDFGIVAMATLTYGILEIFFEMGVDLYLIRTPDCSRADWDTAWTLRLFQGLCLAGLLVALAPAAAWYFDEPRVVAVIHWLAITAVFRGAENIGIVQFRKDLDFASDFRFGLYGRLLNFFVVVPAAVLMQSYWALVIGQVAGSLLRMLLSFRMHPYRPRFSLARMHAVLKLSIHMVFLSVARFLAEKSDSFVVGRIASATLLGPYTVAAEVSAMATDEVVMPVGRALMPNYAKVIHDPDRFVPAYLYSISAVAILCCALGMGLSSVARDFVLVLLGSKWVGAIPLVEWLALYSLINAISLSFGAGLLLFPGFERIASGLAFGRLLVLVPAVAISGILWGVQAVAIAATLAAIIYFPVVIIGVTHVLPVTKMQILGALWRPAISGAIMAFFVRMVELPTLPPVIGLATDVFAGAVVYSFMMVVLWLFSGRPEGPERLVVGFMATRIASRFRN